MKNKTALVILIVGLVVSVGIIFLGNSGGSSTTNTYNAPIKQVQNSEIRDGVQYITINAKGGYSPRVSTGKADIPTKLIVKTDGTYDCSASLSIRSVGFQKILARTGEETIDLGIPKTGEPITGVCGMGMYNFEINFK